MSNRKDRHGSRHTSSYPSESSDRRTDRQSRHSQPSRPAPTNEPRSMPPAGHQTVHRSEGDNRGGYMLSSESHASHKYGQLSTHQEPSNPILNFGFDGVSPDQLSSYPYPGTGQNISPVYSHDGQNHSLEQSGYSSPPAYPASSQILLMTDSRRRQTPSYPSTEQNPYNMDRYAPEPSYSLPLGYSTSNQIPETSDSRSARDRPLGYSTSNHIPHASDSRPTRDPPLGYPPSARDPYTLDPRYTVQPRSYFRVGKVFSILWHENLGSTPNNGTHKSAGPQFEGRFGESIYSTIRRMVVIREKGNCCWCFAISTYGGRGVAKPGVDATKHTIVYMQDGYAMHGSTEPFMTKEPLEVAPVRPDETLDGMSRLNFGKIYTVEHNVKILPIGAITPTSLPKFLNYARTELN